MHRQSSHFEMQLVNKYEFKILRDLCIYVPSLHGIKILYPLPAYIASYLLIICDWLCKNPSCLNAKFDLFLGLKNHITLHG